MILKILIVYFSIRYVPAAVVKRDAYLSDFGAMLSMKNIPENPIQNIETCGAREINHEPPKNLLYQPLIKIVGGSTVPYGAYPWTAHVESLNYEGFEHACGGTIVSDTHIVTAAHCLHGLSKREVRIKVGDNDSRTPDQSERIFEIEDWRVHPDFQKGGFHSNDIAVIKIKKFQGKGIEFNKFISPACLPTEKTSYEAGLKCYVSGWGLLHNDAFYPSDTMRAATVPLIADDICQSNDVIGRNRMKPGMMCAGYLNGGIDACNGDSGGPLVCKINGRHTLLGVVSWGIECAKTTKPGIYSNVKYYLNFINDAIKTL